MALGAAPAATAAMQATTAQILASSTATLAIALATLRAPGATNGNITLAGEGQVSLGTDPTPWVITTANLEITLV